MVRLTTVRAGLSYFAANSQGFVAIFIGGTSGIGEAAVKGFARWATGAKAYLVGRNVDSAAQTLEVCRALSPSSTFEFIQQDVILLKDINRICRRIAELESKVDLLFMTPDIPTLSGRIETEEHLDRLMSLRYYGRMRFIHNLLPVLEKAPAPRVVSVLGPKKLECGLNLDDLGLKKRYGNIASYSHCSIMNTLCMEEYSARHPTVSYVHVYPGLVLTTNIISGPLPWAVRKLIQWIIYPICRIFAQSYEEAGDRMMFISLSASLPPRSPNATASSALLPCSEEVAVLIGSDDIVGSGSYCVDWKAKRMNNSMNLKGLRSRGGKEKVWEHTLEAFGDISNLTS